MTSFFPVRARSMIFFTVSLGWAPRGDPVVNAFQIDLLVCMTRVVVADHFDETAVARAAAVANNNTMASLVQLAGSA